MRDDFSEEVKRSISARVGNICSRCGALTSGPQLDPTRALNVGVAAHITAASPLGPRYDPSLTPEQRRHPDNAVWLCQTCAKLADNDSHRFTVQDLRNWKGHAEAAALALIGRSGRQGESSPDLEVLLTLDPRVGFAAPQGRVEHAFRVLLRNVGQDEVAEYRVEIEFPAGLIDTPSKYGLHWVRQRSDSRTDFFRFTQAVHRPPQIYPGDTVEVFSLRYSTDHVTPGERFAKVTVYQRGGRPVTGHLDVSPANLGVRA